MTITIDIPAISELAKAINNLAESQQGTRIHFASGSKEPLGEPGQRGIPVTPDGQIIEPTISPQNRDAVLEAMTAPKRTRRTKAEMEAAKAIEDKLGRRTDAPTEENIVTDQPEPIEQVSALVDEANASDFTWTFPLLKETFIDPIKPTDDSEEEKARVNGLRAELVAIRKEVDPDAQSLAVMKTEAYGPFAAKATAWYAEKGLDLNLPEGAAV